jgi:serine protease Do
MTLVIVAALLTGALTGFWIRSQQEPPRPRMASLQTPRDTTAVQALEQDTFPIELASPQALMSPDDSLPDETAAVAPPTGILPRGRGVSEAPLVSNLNVFADVAEGAAPAVVTVMSERSLDEDSGLFQRFFGQRHPRVDGHGSGFLIDPNGIVVTNYHVVDGADRLQVRLLDGTELDASLIAHDDKTDLALLRVEASGLPTLRLGDSDLVRIGEWVVAIGSPFRRSLGHTVTTGIISGKGRDGVDLTDYEDFLQTDAAVNPGNSGGPLLNLQGQVIGINTAIATQNGSYQGVSFAISSNLARTILERLLREGQVTRAWLGVMIEPVSSELAERLGLEHPEGIRIGEVRPHSPAERAGLRERDVIIALDGEPARRVSSFRNQISLRRPGETVRLQVLREGEAVTLSVELAELTPEVANEAWRVRSDGAPTAEDLGLVVDDVTPELAQRFELDPSWQGAVIVDVRAGSQAEAVGLQPGDVIRSVGRRAVDSALELTDALRRAPSDRPLTFKVRRQGTSMQIELTPAS